MTAARTGDVETVGALLAHGANINATEAHSQQTALMSAAAEGNAQAVEALLKAGADFKTRDRYGFSPLLYAARGDRRATGFATGPERLMAYPSKMALGSRSIPDSRSSTRCRERRRWYSWNLRFRSRQSSDQGSQHVRLRIGLVVSLRKLSRRRDSC